MRIVFATGNQDKMREIREILSDLDMEIVSMEEAGVYMDVNESGTSFSENAQIKATVIAQELQDRNQQAGKALDIRTQPIREPHHHVKAAVAIEQGACTLASYRESDSVLNIAYVQAKASSLVTINVDG